MGQFTRSFEGKRTIKTVTVPVLVDEEHVDLLDEIITNSSADISADLTNITASSGIAEALITYTGPNADVNHVKRILTKGGLQYVTKRPKSKKEDVEA